MGEIRKGILGGFSGKVGTVVGANYRGKDVMRSLPKRSNRPATQAQREQRLKFAIASKFIAPIAPLLRSFYGEASGTASKRNLSLSYHITEAVTGVYPNFMIDYPKVEVTKGEIRGVHGATATPQAGTLLEFAWEDDSTRNSAKPDDLFLAVVYNESKKEFEYDYSATRNTASFELQLPSDWAGDVIQCWGSFLTADLKKQATSSFIAAVTVL